MAKAKTLTIIGGGTSGWMTAAYISRRCRGAVQVRLIDKEVSVNVGVGEALLLSFNDFMEDMGYKMQEWFNYCECTLKAGIMFEGWGEDGKLIWHPFKFTYFAGLPLYDYWSKDQSQSLRDLQAQFKSTKNNRIEQSEIDKIFSSDDPLFVAPEQSFEEHTPDVDSLIPSQVRMVQLFLNSESEPKFKEMVSFLQEKYDINNLTDTVYQAIENEYNRSKTDIN